MRRLLKFIIVVLLLLVLLLTAVLVFRAPIIKLGLKQGLASQKLQLVSVGDLDLHWRSLNLHSIDILSVDDNAQYRARGLKAEWALFPFHMQRVEIKDLKLTVATREQANTTADSAILLHEVLSQWRALPAVAVAVEELQIQRTAVSKSAQNALLSSEKEGVSVLRAKLNWQHAVQGDSLKITRQDEVLQLDSKWQDQDLQIALVLTRSDKPVVDGQLLLSAATESLVANSTDNPVDISVESTGESKSISAAPSYVFSGKGNLQIASLLQSISEWVKLPQELDSTEGKMQFALAGALSDDAVLSTLQFQLVQGASLNGLVKNADGEEFSFLVNLIKPLILRYDGSRAVDESFTLTGGPLKLQLNDKAKSLDLTAFVAEVNCRTTENCVAQMQVAGKAKKLQFAEFNITDAALKGSAGISYQEGKLTLLDVGLQANALSLVSADVAVASASLKASKGRVEVSPLLQLTGNLKRADITWKSIKSGELSAQGELALDNSQFEYVESLKFSTALNLSSLKVKGSEQWMPELNVKANVTLNGQQIDAKGSLASTPKKPIVSFGASHNMGSGRGKGELNSEQLKFTKKGLSAWLPKLPWPVEIVSGELSVLAKASWQQSKAGVDYSGAIDIETSKLSGFYESIVFIDVDGSFPLVLDTLGLSTRSPYTLDIAKVDAGIPINSIALKGVLDTAKPRFEISGASAELFGGQLTASSYVWPNNGDTINVSFNSLNLQRILTAIDYAPVTGDGAISGNFPMTISTNSIAINAGKLQADAPGVIHYRPDKATLDSLPKNAQLRTVTKVLDNFQYRQLSSDINYSSGDLRLGLHIQGSNPSVENGRQVLLNLNIEDNIPALIESLQASRKVTDILEKNLVK